jgi:hypothetical protein
MRAAVRKHERALQRRFTERLYDLRVQCYPRAFEITGGITSEQLHPANTTPEHLRNVRSELLAWNRTAARLAMSEPSVRAVYRLRDALAMEPVAGERFSREELDRLWHAKNELRDSLRRDVGLLYAEEGAAVHAAGA